jgi:hypothetical protein
MTEDHRHPEAASAAEGSGGVYRAGVRYSLAMMFDP